MSEIAKYEAYKKKLQGICDENNLVFRFRRDTYPITLTIKPVGGMGVQLSMLENVEETGYTSPDAYIMFTYKDGDITYKTSETFTIGEALFKKILNLFKNMYFCWLQYFFRDVWHWRRQFWRVQSLIEAAPAPLPEPEEIIPEVPAIPLTENKVGQLSFF